MRRQLADYRVFLKEFRRTFHTTGALLPSSPGLSRELSRYVAAGADSCRADGAGRRIMEVGPGTGAVTRSIVRRLGAGDRLDLVEVNKEFVAHLRDLLDCDPELRAVADRTTIIHRAIQDVPDTEHYDAIVSCLPLNNFSADDVDRILGTFRRLLKPAGTLSFFEYVAVRPFRGTVGSRRERQRLRAIGRSLGTLLGQHEFHRRAIWINVPPAWVHHLRFGNSGRQAHTAV